MDGLMLDSERIARIAWQEAVRRSGHELPDALFMQMIGRTKFDSIGLLTAAFGTDFNFERTYLECGVIYEKYIGQHGLPLKPGVRELLDDLTARKVPLGVATSTHNPVARQRLEQVGLLGYFATVVGGNEVTRGKPAPDIYLEAVRRLGINAAQSFALEDSHAGVSAAYAAGLKVIMVPDLVPATDELAQLTVLVAESLLEAQSYFRDLFKEPYRMR
jgi:HAD superfamily hydrolase (TIGR01509 family)